jgi:hypothetical protein
MPNQLETLLTKLDWEQLQHSLDENGYAKLPRLLDSGACTTLINGYDDEQLYRKTIDIGWI